MVMMPINPWTPIGSRLHINLSALSPFPHSFPIMHLFTTLSAGSRSTLRPFLPARVLPTRRCCGVRAALEDKRSNEFPQSYPMNGGVGVNSYAQNSKYQVSFFIYLCTFLKIKNKNAMLFFQYYCHLH
jgi:hypothetical protein